MTDPPHFTSSKSGVTHICRAHHSADLFHRVEVRAKSTMHSEDLLVDDSRNGQAVEAVGEGLPQPDVVPPLALVVEAIDTIDRCALVVTAKDEEVLRVFDLVCQQQTDGLERLLTSVDVVAEEEVVCFRWEATILEQSQKVVILPVDITADLLIHVVSILIYQDLAEAIRVCMLPRRPNDIP